MTQIFTEDGKAVPVTKIEAGPCFISAIKTVEKDGYNAVQLAYMPKKKGNKPQKGQFKNISEADFFQFVREFRVAENDAVLEKVKPGQELTANVFEKGEKVRASGTTKGKGFQGVVKRHGFAGSPASHGHKDQLRMPGSIGATGPAHVFKGTRMPGQMGAKKMTTTNLEIIDIDAENNILYLKGAVPGARNGLIIIKNEAEFKLPEKIEVKEVEKSEKKDEKKEEKKPEEKKETKSEDKNKPEAK